MRLDNPNAIYLDVSGWKLFGDVDYKLVAGTVIPPGGSLYILKDRIAFTAAHKGEMKFMTGNFSGTMTTRATSLTVTDKTGFVAGTAAYAGSPSPAQDALRIVELMYNPAGTNLEYLVLKNIGANALALGGVTFAAGISYTFPAGTTLAAGPRSSSRKARSPASFRTAARPSRSSTPPPTR